LKLDITPINSDNLSLVADLLYERNRTLRSYTEWKYRSNNDDRFRGVIGIANGKAIGCFGSIPRDLILYDGTLKKVGWFADWYVSPAARGIGIGKLLLNALSDYEIIMFGHPGPKLAHDICMENGYRSIGFHSRRRLIIRRWSYHRKRGTLFHALKDKIIKKVMTNFVVNDVEQDPRGTSDKGGYVNEMQALSCSFVQAKYYERWIQNQPIAKQFKRESGEWGKEEGIIKFFDEQLENGERRRSLLFIDAENITNMELWVSFINDTKKENLDYIEVFTTNRRLDMLLRQLGAWHIKEAPILIRGLDNKSITFCVQPWDRENWTNLSLYKR
jgi:GNAT superfamily N-acetyltransferase